ncbi:hypothetical protein [Martelella sp. FOR1707]
MNIVKEGMEVPGLIEFSNLRPIGNTIVYMPTTQLKWNWNDQQFVDELLRRVRRALFSTRERRFIMSTVIGGVLRLVVSNPTPPEITDGHEIRLHDPTGHDRSGRDDLSRSGLKPVNERHEPDMGSSAIKGDIIGV